MTWKRFEVKQPVSQRAPDEDSLVKTTQKELWPFFQQVRSVLNWAVRWLGKVQVDSDQTPVELEKAAIAGAGVTITKTGVTPAKKLTFSADVAAIVNNPTFVSNLTTNTTFVNSITNITTVAPPDPAVAETTLYTAKIEDPLLRAPCRCHLAFASGVGWNSDQWTAIGGVSTWKHNYLGAIAGWVYGGTTAPLNVGDRIYIASDAGAVGIGSGQLAGPSPYLGIYEVLDVGSATTYAVIRRATDANTAAALCHDMVVEVTSGLAGGSDYPAITTANPIAVDTTQIQLSYSITWATPYVPTERFELLTSAQLSTEGVTSETLVDSWTFAGIGTADGHHAFTTLIGTPGLSVLPKGMWTANLPEVWVDDDSSGFTFFKWRILQLDGSTVTDLFEIVSQPLGMSAQALTPQYFQPADIAFSPTYKLVAVPAMYTTSATPVTVFFRYSDAAHTTWIKVPFNLPVSGTISGVHNDLTGREATLCHKLLQPGHQAVTTVSGIVPALTCNELLVTADAGLNVAGMKTAGLISGTCFSLTFTNACTVKNQATVGAGEAPFYLTTIGGDLMDLDIAISSNCVVQYWATELAQSPCFRLIGGPTK